MVASSNDVLLEIVKTKQNIRLAKTKSISIHINSDQGWHVREWSYQVPEQILTHRHTHSLLYKASKGTENYFKTRTTQMACKSFKRFLTVTLEVGPAALPRKIDEKRRELYSS